VLVLDCEGSSNKEIANGLGLSVSCIASHNVSDALYFKVISGILLRLLCESVNFRLEKSL